MALWIPFLRRVVVLRLKLKCLYTIFSLQKLVENKLFLSNRKMNDKNKMPLFVPDFINNKLNSCHKTIPVEE